MCPCGQVQAVPIFNMGAWRLPVDISRCTIHSTAVHFHAIPCDDVNTEKNTS